MADIFGRQDQFLAGGLSADFVEVVWPNLPGNGLGLLIQQVRGNYKQSIRRIFEIGPGINVPFPLGGVVRLTPVYFIISRPTGRVQFQRFVGLNLITQEFYRTYGSPCSGNNLVLQAKVGNACPVSQAGSAVTVRWTMHGVLLDDVNFGVNAQDLIVDEGIGAEFAGLSLDLGVV